MHNFIFPSTACSKTHGRPSVALWCKYINSILIWLCLCCTAAWNKRCERNRNRYPGKRVLVDPDGALTLVVNVWTSKFRMSPDPQINKWTTSHYASSLLNDAWKWRRKLRESARKLTDQNIIFWKCENGDCWIGVRSAMLQQLKQVYVSIVQNYAWPRYIYNAKQSKTHHQSNWKRIITSPPTPLINIRNAS